MEKMNETRFGAKARHVLPFLFGRETENCFAQSSSPPMLLDGSADVSADCPESHSLDRGEDCICLPNICMSTFAGLVWPLSCFSRKNAARNKKALADIFLDVRSMSESKKQDLLVQPTTEFALMEQLEHMQAEGEKVEVSSKVVEAEIHRAEIEVEKLLLNLEQRIDEEMERRCFLSDTSRVRKARKKAKQAKEAVLEKMQEEVSLTQERYGLVNNRFLKELKRLEEDKNGSLRLILEKRHNPIRCETAEGREREVARLAQTMFREHQREADSAIKTARCDEDRASEERERAELTNLQALEVLENTKELVAIADVRRRALKSSSTTGSAESNAKILSLVSKMLEEGEVNVDKLENVVSIHSPYVWVWEENYGRFEAHAKDYRRHGSKISPFVHYAHKLWAKLEANFLLFKAGGGQSFSSVEVYVDSNLYSINFANMKQRNQRTGRQRQVKRVCVGTLENMITDEFYVRRRHALQHAERAAADAAQKCWKAEEEEKKVIYSRERADELVKAINVMSWDVPYPNGSCLGLDQIPMDWSPMNGELYLEVLLDEGALEYERVANFFSKSIGFSRRIRAIRRIQNTLLWHLFHRDREMLRSKELNNGNPNEEYLWHGSRKVGGALEKILVGGFDAEYSRCSPKGIWLSTNSKYSVDFCPSYRIGDGSLVEKMLLVRVALGYIGEIRGVSLLETVNGIEVDSHHHGRESRGHHRKDDQTGGGTDRHSNMYVVNKNNQLYPAYVVEFK